MNTNTVEQIKSEISALQAKLDEILARQNVLPEHDFDIALHQYADHLVADYVKWSGDSASTKEKMEASKFGIEFVKGRKFLKVVARSWGSRSSHSFICVQPHGNWKFGDILKSASWNQPAKNFARGNVLVPASYQTHRWCGL